MKKAEGYLALDREETIKVKMSAEMSNTNEEAERTLTVTVPHSSCVRDIKRAIHTKMIQTIPVSQQKLRFVSQQRLRIECFDEALDDNRCTEDVMDELQIRTSRGLASPG